VAVNFTALTPLRTACPVIRWELRTTANRPGPPGDQPAVPMRAIVFRSVAGCKEIPDAACSQPAAPGVAQCCPVCPGAGTFPACRWLHIGEPPLPGWCSGAGTWVSRRSGGTDPPTTPSQT
jgi:hypothetical protein